MEPQLGEFEQMVLLAVLAVGEGAYGVPIAKEIERRTGREVSPSAVYVTLRRLERKGLVESWMSEPRPERGGKSRKVVEVRPEGRRLLGECRARMTAMWNGLEAHIEEAT